MGTRSAAGTVLCNLRTHTFRRGLRYEFGLADADRITGLCIEAAGEKVTAEAANIICAVLEREIEPFMVRL